MGEALVNKMGNWQRKTNNPSNKPDTTTLQTSSSDKVFITWFKKKNHPETIQTLSYDLQNKRNISISKDKSEIKNWKKLSTSNILKIDKVAKLCRKSVRFFCLHFRFLIRFFVSN